MRPEVLFLSLLGVVRIAAGDTTFESARQLYLTGRYEEAIEQYRSLDEENNAAVALGVARCEAAAGEYDKAIQRLEQNYAARNQEKELLFVQATTELENKLVAERKNGEDQRNSNLLLKERQRISTIYFSMTEDNLRLQVREPWIKFSTDAGGLNPEHADTPTHPRAYGTYPRVLRKYVREEKLITLEEAIRKMTSSVAARLSIRDRGLVAPGYFADLVLFDPDTITDHATFEDSHQLSTGVQQVWVNGTQVIVEGKHTGALPGQFVRGPGARH